MRFNGTIKTWNDERGFGFITPSRGGQEIFVHIKAFPSRSARPQVGESVTFEIELNRDGKKRATAVKPLNAPASFRKHRQGDSARWGVASYLAIPAFMVLYVAAAFLWEVPAWVVGIYVGASVLAFATYGIDKYAAVADTRRVPEYALLITRPLGRLAWSHPRSADYAAQVEQGIVSFGVLAHRLPQCSRFCRASFAAGPGASSGTSGALISR